jgi:hypothetical protein
VPHPHASLRHGRRPHRGRAWWIGVLFSIGSLCFFVGPFPGFVQEVGSVVDGWVFFIGSVFFTSAAILQLIDTNKEQATRLEVRSSEVQVAGTLMFNISTFRALSDQVGDTSYNRMVWAPDAFGSVLFLISGVMAYQAVTGGLLRRPPRTRGWTIAFVNLLGCVAFAVSAVGAYVVPSSGDVRDLAAANAGTVIGAACFLVGALLLLPSRAGQEARSPATREA